MLQIQILPTFWAEQIWILRITIFICSIRKSGKPDQALGRLLAMFKVSGTGVENGTAKLINSEGFLAEVFHPWVHWEGPGSGFESLSVVVVGAVWKSGISPFGIEVEKQGF